MPAVKAAMREASAQEAVDREELETLWWMFGAYSEIEQKPLAELSPSAAAFCSGIELAKRALLPPTPAAVAMVGRAVETGRKPSTLGALSLPETIGEWSASISTRSRRQMLRVTDSFPVTRRCCPYRTRACVFASAMTPRSSERILRL